MGLREQAKMKLADELIKQGARVRSTKNGYQAFTDKGFMSWHRSESSDRMGDKNLRRDVERLGLEWPF